MELNRELLFVTTVLTTLFMLSLVRAAPTGASVTVGTQERAPSPSPETVTTEGGNVTPVNLSAYQVTTKWAGFWGNVSGDISAWEFWIF